MVAIKLKWNKNEYDVEIEPTESVEVFKTQVWTMTNVPVDRQKYVGFPGGPLKDTDSMADKCAKLKPGVKIMLVGTAEGDGLKQPVEKVVFEEDLSAEEKAKIFKEKKVERLPAGLQNLGNTCYMNSCLQCLNKVTLLRTSLQDYNPTAVGERDIDTVLTTQFKGLVQQMDNTLDTITPMQFLMALRQRFPRFAEMAQGGYAQQDAEECLRGLLTVLASTMKTEGGNKIDDLFAFTMKSKLKCLESDDEEPTETEESQRMLLCHLGTQQEPVSHIHQGIQLSLKEHIEKNSPLLGRNAQYEKSSAICSSPQCLIVQFARFGYKSKNEWAGTDAAKVKLVRKIAFGQTLDIFDLMTDEKKNEMRAGRLRKKDLEDAEIERQRLERKKPGGGDDKGDSSSSAAGPGKDGDVEMTDAGASPMDVETEMMDTGYYELVAILSHKGRTADGGHYVGWGLHKKADGKELKDDRWICFDDDTVSYTYWKEMCGQGTELQGGKADTQMAYLCFYQKVQVPKAKPGEQLLTVNNVKEQADLYDEKKKRDEEAKAKQRALEEKKPI
eukprot:gnl/MRDRNA2_/MRDRNA2_100883_c0_seq1.p1 gnl/MRDRNA2_/MRDRNA2_100883_c0~~gnl/MRDRNA2_/MRDRNA2_100883_c0_seq1.p1  ORF type:complete len:556 (+),score=150.83 gnl/MRDRNA2_/MRDRNA2_100883_c0_seq1:113-1780(+)